MDFLLGIEAVCETQWPQRVVNLIRRIEGRAFRVAGSTSGRCGGCLVWTNPLFIAAFRRWKRFWGGWYSDAVR